MNGWRKILVGAVLGGTAWGQAIAPEVRELFESAGSGGALRCEIRPMGASLNYAFQFQSVYTIDIPLGQFDGSGHGFTTYLRVTPLGREPVYLTKNEMLPEAPEGKADGESVGAFVVGEGSYRAEVRLEDDLHRVCRGEWQIQARRVGSERQLKAPTSAGAVEELTLNGPADAPAKAGARIARLTILVHAAPMQLKLTGLPPEDVQKTVDSVASLLREMPAQSVRVLAFNLDERAIIFSKDGFEANDTGALAAALQRVDFSVLDAKALSERMEPIPLLVDIFQTEMRRPAPPDAVILIGPPSRMLENIPVNAVGRSPATAPPLFSLQFQWDRPPLRLGPSTSGMDASGRGSIQGPLAGDPNIRTDIRMLPATDTIERLVVRLKGQILPIHNPHDLADAIERMDTRIPKAAPPAPPIPVPSKKVTPSTETEVEARLPEPTVGEDPVEVLIRLRDQVLAHGERIPNHTCVETVQRERYEPSAGHALKSCDALMGARKQRPAAQRLKLDSADRLRLDVAYSTSGRELYSWSGAHKFEEGEIDELVPEGAIGTGPFATMLLAAFESRGPKYTFEGEATVAGRRLFEYSFAVVREQSHYRVKAHKDWIITGYSGTLLLDPKTAELVRLTVRTDELPAATGTCETDTSLEYSVVKLEGGDYLLPKVAVQRFIGREGGESENTMSFSACRDFQAESKVEFTTASADSRQADAVAGIADLPTGLAVSIELLTAVHTGEAAAGDRMDGRLAAPIRDQAGRTLVAEGTAVQGRLMRVETEYPRGGESTVVSTIVLRWETIAVGGVRVPLSLLPNRKAPKAIAAGNSLRLRTTGFELPRPGETRYAVITLPAGRKTLESGYRSEWFTAKP